MRSFQTQRNVRSTTVMEKKDSEKDLEETKPIFSISLWVEEAAAAAEMSRRRPKQCSISLKSLWKTFIREISVSCRFQDTGLALPAKAPAARTQELILSAQDVLVKE